MQELFAMAVWACFMARIAFSAQTIRIRVMNKLRKGLIPAMLLAVGLGSLSQAHGTPGPTAATGTNVEVRANGFVPRRDGISLDEAVSRAEAQYRARVVRTDVQDEDGRKIYVLKLLSENGRVFTVRIDAATGRSR
jgi:hypothetical protein